MADETQPEQKKGILGWVIIGIVALVFIVLVLVFRNGGDQEYAPDEVAPIQDTEPVEIIVEEPEIANPAASFCEEQGGIYSLEADTCTMKILKKNALPMYINGLEEQGLECDEPKVDPETNKTSSETVPCYETTVYDAWEYWRENNGLCNETSCGIPEENATEEAVENTSEI